MKKYTFADAQEAFADALPDQVDHWQDTFMTWLYDQGFVVAVLPSDRCLIAVDDGKNIASLFDRFLSMRYGSDELRYRIEFGPELDRDQVVAMIGERFAFLHGTTHLAELVRMEIEIVKEMEATGYAERHIDFSGSHVTGSAAGMWKFRLVISAEADSLDS